jgi:hypothetical protein
MKEILVVAILLLPSFANAKEQPNNPDRFPSFAISFDKGSLDGSGPQGWDIVVPGVLSAWADGDANVSQDIQIITPSLRLPVSNSFTLDVRASFIKNDYEMTGYPNEMSYDLSGQTIGVTGRYYFK